VYTEYTEWLGFWKAASTGPPTPPLGDVPPIYNHSKIVIIPGCNSSQLPKLANLNDYQIRMIIN